MSNAKQHTTFDFEISQAMQKPDPQKHFNCENQTQTTRYKQRSLGLDIKANQKMIKLTPGPGDY